jgi:hypothetical protein
VAVSVLVLVSAALGAGVILLLGAAREVQHRWRQRSLGQQLRAANARIEQLEPAPAPEPQPKALETGETASASGGQGTLRPPGPPA